MEKNLNYLIREPKNIQQKNPLLLLLHGYGSNEQDLFSFASEMPEDYYIISLQAPYDLQYGSYAWYAINFDADQNKFSDIDQAVQSRDLIASFIQEITKKYNIDHQKITLMGFSQGAILSYAVAMSHPNLVQRIACFSGYLNTEMVTPNQDFSNLDIFASHGTMDQVIPVSWAQKTKPFFENQNIQIQYHEYPIGHGISPQNFFDFKKWLQK